MQDAGVLVPRARAIVEIFEVFTPFRGAERHDDVGSQQHDYGLEDDEEDEEDEDLESVEEFDESVYCFEHSGWLPVRICTSHCGGGCVRRWECTFAHGEQELQSPALS